MILQSDDDITLDDLINPASDSDVSFESVLMQDYRLDASGKVCEFKSYRTVLSVPAKLAAKVPAVRISAEADTTLHIAGADYQIGPGKWQSLAFDGTGELTMSIPASAVHTPALRISLGSLAANDFLVVAPDEDLHTTLASLQAADLTAADRPLLPAEQNDQAESIAAAVRQVALLAQSSAPTTEPVSFGLLSSIKKGVKKATTTVAHTATSVTTTVTHAVTQEAVKIADTAYHDAAKGVSFVAKRGALTNGFAAADGTLSFLVKEGGKAVSKVINFAVKTREEAWELVHKVFEQLKLELSKVLAWLAKELGWKDILATKRAFDKIVIFGLNGIKDGASGLSAKLNKKISALRGKSDQLFDNAIANLGKKAVAGGKKVTPANTGAHSLWLHHKLKDYSGKMSLEKKSSPSTTATTSSASDSPQTTAGHASVKAFLAKLEQTLVGKNASDEYKKSLQLIKTELANPANLPEVLPQVLLLVIKGITGVALGVIDVLVEGVLALVGELAVLIKDVLTYRVHIPFISDLYKLIAGDDLSLLDLLSLVIASIVTPIYKAAHHGAAPFASATTTTGPQSFADDGDEAAAKRRQLNQELVAVIIGFSMIFEVWDDTLSMGATDEAEEGEAIPSWILLFIDLVIQTMMVSGDGGPGDNYPAFLSNFTSGADSALENSIWLFEWLPIAFDIFSLGYSIYEGHGSQLMRSEGKWGPVVEFTLGLILILAAAGQLAERLTTKSTSSYQAGLEFGYDLSESIRLLGKMFLEGKDPVELGILIGIDIATCSTAAGLLPFISG